MQSSRRSGANDTDKNARLSSIDDRQARWTRTQCRSPQPLQSGHVTLVTVSAVIWSVWVSVNGIVFREAETAICAANNFNLETLCWYVPEFSPLIYPFIKTKALTSWDMAGILLGAAVAIVLIVPMLVSRVREYAVLALSHDG